ncbi:KH domain-containing protein [Kurthia senegalensis]|uniref:KH domain-containing protein n=1 Tax=Kurthia senegalensis TaxID=1033740 RepID=UPI000287FE23|nr:KH domain-containing protein [Kurthia senegalensis]
MKQLITTIVKPLVDFPDDIHVMVEESEHRIVYKLAVNPKDIGKVIGKQGSVAKAIRTIVYSAASSHQMKKTYVEIID